MSYGLVMVLVILVMLLVILSIATLYKAGRIVETNDKHNKIVNDLLNEKERLIEEKEHATRASKA